MNCERVLLALPLSKEMVMLRPLWEFYATKESLLQ